MHIPQSIADMCPGIGSITRHLILRKRGTAHNKKTGKHIPVK